MTVVKEYVTESGVTIRFHDDAYRDKTPEEIQAIRENISRVASQCLTAEMERRAEEEQSAAT